MKQYLLSLLAVAALVGCTRFEDEASLAVVNATDPTITVGTVEDTGFTATITAAAGTGFYSYAVIPGAAQTLDPTTLLKVGAKNTLVAGTVDYTKGESNHSKTIELKELDRNTTYSIYAVAASEQGTVGKVVTAQVITSDGQNPSPKSFEFKDGVFTLTLSEGVKYTDKAITANYYAVNTPKGADFNILENKPVGSVPVKVEAKGSTVSFTLEEEVPDGAYIAVSYPAGAFEDAVGNPAPALNSGFSADKDGNLKASGMTGRQPVVNFDLTLYSDEEEGGEGEDEGDEEEEPMIVSDLLEPFILEIPEGLPFFKSVDSKDPKAEGYKIVYENESETHIYTTPGQYDYFWYADEGIALVYPNAYSGRPDPTPGDYVTITIPEGFIVDIYGNVSNEFVIGPFMYSFGYTLEDLLGTYKVSGATKYASYTNSEVVIAPAPESEEEDAPDVIIYNLFKGMNCCDDLDSFTNDNPSVPAYFDCDGGVLTFAGIVNVGKGDFVRPAYGYDWHGTVQALYIDGSTGYPCAFQMPESGKMTLANGMTLYLAGLGSWDSYAADGMTLERISTEYTVPTTTALPAPKKAKGPLSIQNKSVR